MIQSYTTKQQVLSGIRRAGGWLIGAAWLGLVFRGLTESFASEQAFAEGHHPSRSLGYVLLGIAALTMVVTAERWKRVFPGIMLAAILNSLLELTRGHAVNNPAVPVGHSTAIIHLVVTTGVTVLALTFKNRRLTVLDRFALLAFVVSFFWGAVEQRFASVKLIVGACCILIAWAIDRLKTDHVGRSSSIPTPSS